MLIEKNTTLTYKTPEAVTDRLKDSGARQVFQSGAQRDRSKGKGIPSLVPGWVVWLVSRIYEDGAVKYTPRNWEKGMPLSQYIDSAERHLMKLKAGLRDEPHASQALWNLIGYVFTGWLIHRGLRPKELNDMPDHTVPGIEPIAEPLSPYEYRSLETFFGIELPKSNYPSLAEVIVPPKDGRLNLTALATSTE